MIVGLCDGRSAKGIRFENIRAYGKVLAMNILDDLGLGNREDIVVAFQRKGMILKTLSPEIAFFKVMTLDHRAHGAVDDENTLL
jgi:hypothetical protein